MLVTRTPFRISFAGGGTDFESYYSYGHGSVISTTINKYVYVTANRKFDGKIHLRYSDTECVSSIKEVKHDILREALRMTGITEGIEIVTISDIPMTGSGLGSSSALAVGALNALYNLLGYSPSPYELAERACQLEIDILKAPIGKQDQYASAFGGINRYVFKLHDVLVESINTAQTYTRLKQLEKETMLFYLNKSRSSNSILAQHESNIHKFRNDLDLLREGTRQFQKWLESSISELSIADIVNMSWGVKKKLAPMCTSTEIDELVIKTIYAGAGGVKLCGAGFGGFMMVIAKECNQNSVRAFLKNYPELPIKFSMNGSEVVYNDKIC